MSVPEDRDPDVPARGDNREPPVARRASSRRDTRDSRDNGDPRGRDSSRPRSAKPPRSGWNVWVVLAVVGFVVLFLAACGWVLVKVTTGRSNPPSIAPSVTARAVPPPPPAFSPPTDWAAAPRADEVRVKEFVARFGKAVRDPEEVLATYVLAERLFDAPDPPPAPGGPGGNPEPPVTAVLRRERATWRTWVWDKAEVVYVLNENAGSRLDAVVWVPKADGERAKIRWTLVRVGPQLQVGDWEDLRTGIRGSDLCAAAHAAANHDSRRDRRAISFRDLAKAFDPPAKVRTYDDDGESDDPVRTTLDDLDRGRFDPPLQHAIDLAEAQYDLTHRYYSYEDDEDADEAKPHAIAVELCEKVLAVDPRRAAAYRLLARAQLARKEYDLAVDTCKTLVFLTGPDPDALALRGQAHAKLNDAPAADADFAAALDREPGNAAALTGLRRLLSLDDKRAFTARLAKAQFTPAAFAEVAAAARADADFPVLVAVADKYLAEHPDDPIAVGHLIAARCAEKKYDAAVALFKRAVVKTSGEPRATLVRGFVILMADADRHAEAYAAVPPADAPAAFRQLAGGLSAASHVWTGGADNDPRFADQKKKAAAADAVWGTLVARHLKAFPDDRRARYHAGLRALRANQYADAEKELAAAMAGLKRTGEWKADNESGYDSMRYARVEALYRLGRSADAVKELRPVDQVFGQLVDFARADDPAGGPDKLLAECGSLVPAGERVYWRAEAAWAKKKYRETVALCGEYRTLPPDPDATLHREWAVRDRLIRGLVRLGRGAEAVRLTEADPDATAVHRALAFASSGSAGRAVGVMTEASGEWAGAVNMFYNDDDLGPLLRTGAAFQAFRKKFPPREPVDDDD